MSNKQLGITQVDYGRKFKKARKKFSGSQLTNIDDAIRDISNDNFPPGRNLEPVRRAGSKKVYSIRVDYHNRLSFEVIGTIAMLRNVAAHDELYRSY